MASGAPIDSHPTCCQRWHASETGKHVLPKTPFSSLPNPVDCCPCGYAGPVCKRRTASARNWPAHFTGVYKTHCLSLCANVFCLEEKTLKDTVGSAEISREVCRI